LALLDEKLSDKEQLKSLIAKGTKVARIVLSLSGISLSVHGGEPTRPFFFYYIVLFLEARLNIEFSVLPVIRVFGQRSNGYNIITVLSVLL